MCYVTDGSSNLVTIFQTSFRSCKSCLFFSLSLLVDADDVDEEEKSCDSLNTRHMPRFLNKMYFGKYSSSQSLIISTILLAMDETKLGSNEAIMELMRRPLLFFDINFNFK